MSTGRVDLHHQYPWKRQEIITLIALFLIPCATFALLVMGGAGRGTFLGTGITVAVLSWGLGLYAFRLGFTRKRGSRIEGILDGTTFTFKGGRFKRSRGDLAEHDRISLRTAGIETALVFSHDTDDAESDPEVLVPLRLVRQNAAGHDDLSQALRSLTARDGLTITPDARSAIDSL